MRLGNRVLSQLAMHDDPILYVTFSKAVGCQFFRQSLGLSPFGKQIILPSLCAIDISPFATPSFKDLTTKTPKLFPKEFQKVNFHSISSWAFSSVHTFLVLWMLLLV